MQRIVWREGLFLRPQHLQKQDQLWVEQIHTYFDFKMGYAWGLSDFAVHRNLLAKGEISIRRLAGIMPDGTAFELHGQEQRLSLNLSKNIGSGMVYLVLAKYNSSGINIVDETHSDRRFLIQEQLVQDEFKAQEESVNVEILVPNFCLRFCEDVSLLDGFVVLPLLQISEVRASGEIVLDDHFIPPLLRLQVDEQLQSYVQELAGLLSQRRVTLLERIGGADQYGVAGITELLLLQIVNRYESLLEHYRRQVHLHPEQIYVLFLQLAGELATFTSEARAYVEPPLYEHLNLQTTFCSLMHDLRAAFNYVFDEPAVLVPFVAYKYQLYLANLLERVRFNYQRLILAVRADMPLEQLRHLFPVQVKIGPREQIKDLVNLQLPGITLDLLPLPPRQIPYHNGYIYFELDPQADLWAKLKESPALALHLSGNFPGVALQLWAMK